MLFNKILMMLRLFVGEYPADDATVHWQDTVTDPGGGIAWVQQQTDATVVCDQPISGDDAILDQGSVEIGFDPFSD